MIRDYRQADNDNNNDNDDDNFFRSFFKNYELAIQDFILFNLFLF